MPIKYFSCRLAAIRVFLERSLNIDDKYVHIFLNKKYTEEEWAEYGEAEHDQAFDVLLDYQEIVARAALGELNALVEYELKWVARSIQRNSEKKAQKDSKSLSRGEACRLIEEKYGIKLKDLPGFTEVDEIRKIVNAYKHDDGYSDEYEPFFTGYVEKRYELDPEKAMNYLDPVRDFLTALPGELSNLGEDVRVKFSQNRA